MLNLFQYFKHTSKETKSESSSDVEYEINPEIRTEIDKAQMRSLKARTEITMLYDSLAHDALYKIKGLSHATNT